MQKTIKHKIIALIYWNMEKQEIEYYASQIVDAGFRVHKELGPGLLESVYLFCLKEELKLRVELLFKTIR